MKLKLLILAASFVASLSAVPVSPAGFSLDNVFTDHMVIQRDKPVRLSGWADPGTRVTVAFAGQKATVSAGSDGRWVAELPAVPAGGPYSIVVRTDRGTGFMINDVLVGDVWICSGQSNMEMPIWCGNQYYRRLDGKDFAASFKDSRIRLLQVPKAVGVGEPFTELSGRPSWKTADTPAAIEEFSFTGLSFGQALRAAVADVPIGLVNASWGGTLIEPWIPYRAYKDAGYAEVVAAVGPGLGGDLDALAEKAKAQTEKMRRELLDWVGRFKASAPDRSAAALAAWGKPGLDVSDWRLVTSETISGMSEPGIAWYRFEFEVPAGWVGKELVFHADYVNDADETYFDGELIGRTGPATMPTGYWSAPRDYRFKPLTAGPHVIAIRAEDHFDVGGIGPKLCVNGPDGDQIVFREFLEKVEFKADRAKLGDRPPVPPTSGDARSSPQTWTALYNTMIHPLTAMNVKGVIWYQGCSNATAYRRYPALQRLQIDSWRKAFRDDALPFVITQLSAFKEHKPERRPAAEYWNDLKPADFGFARMRDAQLESVTGVPAAGIACTIDVGMMYDIHPKNKQEVGRRLAHEARRIAYGREAAAPGPKAAGAKREGRKVRVTFKDAGAGIYAKGGRISGNVFALMDASGESVWAEATLEADGTVLVSSPSVADPVEVRYAYTGFPHEPNLYRKGDELPVFPFCLRLD